MHVETLEVGPLGCKCSILADLDAKEAIVVDPGGDLDEIDRRLSALGVKVKAIVHTHTHIDHVGCTAELQRASGAVASIHEGDRFLYDLLPVQAALLGIAQPVTAELEGDLRDGEPVKAGALSVEVIHTPGHTPGSCSFLLRDGDKSTLFSGDTLFRGGIGRTDLWGGDSGQILRSIRDRLLVLPENTVVVAGHGPTSTIGLERASNPFVRAR